MTGTTNKPIIIGNKPVANYALAIATRIGAGEDEVTLRARGEHIARAVDAANKAVNMGLPVARGAMRWGQETAPGGHPVSYVEVTLTKKEG